jgi:prepilin-type N-terminal cleavage/methylation domain-containing protein
MPNMLLTRYPATRIFRQHRKGVMNAHKFGYSLIELIATLALAGILAAIALPAWNKLLPSHQLDSSLRQFQSELHNIKMRAVAENVGFQLVYANGAADYTIQRDSAVLVTKLLPTGVVITNSGTISFSPRGTASANRIRLRSLDGTCKQVVVSPTGRVRICKPTDCSENC